MPSHVKIFWWLTVIVVTYVVLSHAWYLAFPPAHVLAVWAKVPARFRDLMHFVNIEYFVIAVVANGVWLALAWLAAYRRKNWARWMITIWFLLGLASPLVIYAWYVLVGNHELVQHYWRFEIDAEAKEWENPRSYVVPLVTIAALVFAFTGNARAWFKPPAKR
jgi:hypothetical protein